MSKVARLRQHRITSMELLFLINPLNAQKADNKFTSAEFKKTKTKQFILYFVEILKVRRQTLKMTHLDIQCLQIQQLLCFALRGFKYKLDSRSQSMR